MEVNGDSVISQQRQVPLRPRCGDVLEPKQ